jgi:hypothetical protein
MAFEMSNSNAVMMNANMNMNMNMGAYYDVSQQAMVYSIPSCPTAQVYYVQPYASEVPMMHVEAPAMAMPMVPVTYPTMFAQQPVQMQPLQMQPLTQVISLPQALPQSLPQASQQALTPVAAQPQVAVDVNSIQLAADALVDSLLQERAVLLANHATASNRLACSLGGRTSSSQGLGSTNTDMQMAASGVGIVQVPTSEHQLVSASKSVTGAPISFPNRRVKSYTPILPKATQATQATQVSTSPVAARSDTSSTSTRESSMERSVGAQKAPGSFNTHYSHKVSKGTKVSKASKISTASIKSDMAVFGQPEEDNEPIVPPSFIQVIKNSMWYDVTQDLGEVKDDEDDEEDEEEHEKEEADDENDRYGHVEPNKEPVVSGGKTGTEIASTKIIKAEIVKKGKCVRDDIVMKRKDAITSDNEAPLKRLKRVTLPLDRS